MYSVNVSLGMRSYPINIGQNYFIEPATFSPLKAGERALIVTNTTIAPYYLSRLESTLLQAGIKIETLVLPDGEQYKSLETLNIIFTELLKYRHGRDSTLIALGGGVIGDLVGFAAATYQRGIRFIQVPTTLLAQVDSSVGGKTGVNHSLGKNMVGAFYQPCTVVIDLNSLKTLPMREFSAGLAEVIKYGIILDNAFFVWLEAHLPELMEKNVEALGYCISRCCQIKADVVGQDEKEQGVRALLNLGHTFGHAIETGLGYGNWLHGEAVSVGMVMAANVAMQLDLLAQDDVVRIKQLLLKAGLPIERPPEMKSEDYLPYMRRDKKNITGKIRLVLPTGIGRSAVFDSVTDECIIAAIDAC